MIFNWKSTCAAGLKTTVLAAKMFCIGVLVCITSSGQVHADLPNGGFEEPDTGPLPSAIFIDQSMVPAWQTNAASGLIEIWSSEFNGVPAYEGKQHAELNSDQSSTLFQDVSGIGMGLIVGFEFAHRARVGTDIMRLTITDLGIDDTIGGGDDTVLFTSDYLATTAKWEFNNSIGESPIVALGNEVRFAYEAVSTGSGDLTQGNFIDAANFGVGVAVPEPTATSFLFGVTCLIGLRRRREYKGSGLNK